MAGLRAFCRRMKRVATSEQDNELRSGREPVLMPIRMVRSLEDVLFDDNDDICRCRIRYPRIDAQSLERRCRRQPGRTVSEVDIATNGDIAWPERQQPGVTFGRCSPGTAKRKISRRHDDDARCGGHRRQLRRPYGARLTTCDMVWTDTGVHQHRIPMVCPPGREDFLRFMQGRLKQRS